MQLPQPISQCIRMLEDAGFAAYAVGGCVRDDRMGIVPHDYDLCTSARPEQTEAVFSGFAQVHAGVKHHLPLRGNLCGQPPPGLGGLRHRH